MQKRKEKSVFSERTQSSLRPNSFPRTSFRKSTNRKPCLSCRSDVTSTGSYDKNATEHILILSLLVQKASWPNILVIFEISRSPLVPDRKCLFHFYPRTLFPLFSFIWFSSFHFSHVKSQQRKSTVENVLKTRLQCALLIPSRVVEERENVNSPRNERRADERRAKGTSRLSVAFRLESSCLGLQSHSCRRG